MLSQDLRRTLPTLLAIAIGAWFAIDYFIDLGPLGAVSGYVGSLPGILAAGAMVAGGISVLIRYGGIASKEGPERYYAIVVIISMLLQFISGLPLPSFEPYYQWMNTYIRDPVNLSAYAMVFFFITSAAFRSFRIRSLDTALMVFAAFCVFLMNAPMMEAVLPITTWPGKWFNDYPLFAIRRATTFSSYLGIFLLWMRATLGMEKRSLGVEG